MKLRQSKQAKETRMKNCVVCMGMSFKQIWSEIMITENYFRRLPACLACNDISSQR
jgi:hypothetical protein